MERREKQTSLKREIIALILIANATLVGCVITWKFLKDDPEILINQAGYFPSQAKEFFVRTRYQYTSGTFDVINAVTKARIIDGRNLSPAGDLWNNYYYCGNFTDVTATGEYQVIARFDGAGAVLGEVASSQIVIGYGIYDLALERGYEFFYYQRCGTKVHELVPGYVGHEPCHLDDHIMYDSAYLNLTGGYHSAGDYGKHIYWGMHCEAVPYACLFAYELDADLFNGTDLYDVNGHVSPDNIPDILDEAIFGLDYLKRAFLDNGTLLGSLVGALSFVVPEHDTDNIVGTSDDRQLFAGENHQLSRPYEAMWVAAGFAKMATVVKNTGYFSSRQAELINLATSIYNNYSVHFNFTSPSHPSINSDAQSYLVATLEMFRYFNSPALAAKLWDVAVYIHDHFPDPGSGLWGDELGEWNRLPGFYCYWAMVNGTPAAKMMATDIAMNMYSKRFLPLSNESTNLYGLMKFKYQDNQTTYFWDRTGFNSYYLTAAFTAFMAYNITNGTHPELLQFGFDQVNWVFGRNLFGTCMVESIGWKNPTTYHHRYAYIPGNPRGAVPGAIINGVIDKNGEPFINTNSAAGSTLQDHLADAMSNEPWLPHNIHFMYAIAALRAFIS
nr:glycoside hydrolase family 9 protein [Candidatus Sigynarchaeota archaeon]